MAEQLDVALDGLLQDYNANVINAVDRAGESAIKRMVALTRATAPVSFGRHASGRPRFASSIRYRKEDGLGYIIYTWYVQKPNWRLTHLLENGHATRNGGFVAGRHFVRSAYDAVKDQYITDIKNSIAASEEAI